MQGMGHMVHALYGLGLALIWAVYFQGTFASHYPPWHPQFLFCLF